MYSHFSPSFLLALFAVVLVSVNALPRPLNMHDESILTLSLSPSITPSSTPSSTPFSTPSPSFSPSQTPSTTPSSTPSSAITRSPIPKVSSIKHDSFVATSAVKSMTSTSSSETVAATPLTAADLNMFSTVTGLLGGLASLMGLA